MDFGILAPLVAKIQFGTVALAILAVASSIIALAVVVRAIDLVRKTIIGDRVFYGGKYWDKDVYDNAMAWVDRVAREGRSVDKESRQALRAWRREKRDDDYFRNLYARDPFVSPFKD